MLGEQISLIVLTCIHPVISRGRCMIILWQKIINVGYLVRFNIPKLVSFYLFYNNTQRETPSKRFWPTGTPMPLMRTPGGKFDFLSGHVMS